MQIPLSPLYKSYLDQVQRVQKAVSSYKQHKDLQEMRRRAEQVQIQELQLKQMEEQLNQVLEWNVEQIKHEDLAFHLSYLSHSLFLQIPEQHLTDLNVTLFQRLLELQHFYELYFWQQLLQTKNVIFWLNLTKQVYYTHHDLPTTRSLLEAFRKSEIQLTEKQRQLLHEMRFVQELDLLEDIVNAHPKTPITPYLVPLYEKFQLLYRDYTIGTDKEGKRVLNEIGTLEQTKLLHLVKECRYPTNEPDLQCLHFILTRSLPKSFPPMSHSFLNQFKHPAKDQVKEQVKPLDEAKVDDLEFDIDLDDVDEVDDFELKMKQLDDL
ncbi:hypothetical protein EDD86DRAFT_65857 [Gorgonomyces haynaldii]|nr:hypothetical protein EDD86DRAFT_65857 [Gorgonomyces haynaldii]